MKYIIEIEEIPFTSEGSEIQLFKATEFNSLVFDRNGLEKLTPYDESSAEQRGRKEAWELIKAIGKMSDDDMVNCFGMSIIVNMSYTEAREKYEAWKEQKDIYIGDEVEVYGCKAVILDEIENGWFALTENGCVEAFRKNEIDGKTNRHFSEVDDLLEKMREQS